MRLLLVAAVPPFSLFAAFLGYSFFGAIGFYSVLVGVLAFLLFYRVFDEVRRDKAIAYSKPVPKEGRVKATERFVQEVKKDDEDTST